MKSNVFTSIALAWFCSIISTILVLTFSPESHISWFIGIISILVVNSLHIFLLQLIVLPLVTKDTFSSTDRFFFTLLPWLGVSGLLMCLISIDEPILLIVIAIQYFPAALSFHFYYSEKRKEELNSTEFLMMQKQNTDELEQNNILSTE